MTNLNELKKIIKKTNEIRKVNVLEKDTHTNIQKQINDTIKQLKEIENGK